MGNYDGVQASILVDYVSFLLFFYLLFENLHLLKITSHLWQSVIFICTLVLALFSPLIIVIGGTLTTENWLNLSYHLLVLIQWYARRACI